MIIYRYGKADSTHNKRLLESSMQTGCSPQTIKLLKMGSVDFQESFLYLELKLHFVLKLHVENILHSVFIRVFLSPTNNLLSTNMVSEQKLANKK